METYLPIIKATLSDWILLTLNNPYYAVALAAIVFLVTAFLYSIRVASLEKKNVASENERIEIQKQLDVATQHMQLMQEELAANIELMQKDRQAAQKEIERATKFEELLSQRNKQVAGIIQSLHTSFDLGERPLPVMGDIKAEGLWQQHDRVITLLTTRLQSEQQAKTQLQQSHQAEKVKRAEIEALLETLQTNLATQSSQVSKLEQALEEQKGHMQEQQDKAQLALSQTLEKHLAELARLTELEQQALELVNTRQQLNQLEEKLIAKDALITRMEKDKSVDQVKVQPQPALLKQEKIETIIEIQKTEVETPSALSDIKQQSVNPFKKQTGGLAGKIKNLIDNAKYEIMTGEPKVAESAKDEAEIQPMPSVEEQPSVSAVKDQFGKIKNLFGSKQQPDESQPEEALPEPSVKEQSPVSETKSQFGKIKNLFASKQPPEERQPEEAQPEPSVEEQSTVSAAKSQFGKLKNIFGSKQQPEEAQTELADVEQPPMSTAKSQFGKFKNLFGSKQQAEETQREEETQSEPPVEEQLPVSSVKGQFGKLKNLFGSKQQPEEAQTELADVEQPPMSAAKSQFGKIKNLFGKAK